MRRVVLKNLITLVLIVLSTWLMVHNRGYRTLFYKDYTFKAKAVNTFKHFPKALYAFGLNAWFNNNADAAALFFRQTVRQNIFDMDAWLKLAQAETVLGHPDKARSILQFSDRLTQNIYRWKWDQILLANELGMEKIVFGNINFLVLHRKKLQDAFQLLDANLGGNTILAVQMLDPDNLVPFLEWLMRWGRVGDADIAWRKITESRRQDEDISLKYIHFLISKKHIQRAVEIRRISMGVVEGMTNGGFEKEITGRGFDWRYTATRKNRWTIRRTLFGVFSGEHCLKIIFEGKENISFGHLYQIVAVEPEKQYELTYYWRSRNITTDQGPFVDIYGYDCKGFYCKGPMMLGTHAWNKQEIKFEVPEDCHAVVVRLHRRPSHRFDSKIAGKLWLDEFGLKKMNLKPRDLTF